MDMNDVILNLGGVSHIDMPLDISANDNQITEHLANHCFGENIPTTAQVRANVALYQKIVSRQNVPAELSPRQVRLILNAVGLRDTVEAAVQAADQNTKDMWQYSSTFLRTDPILISMATSIGITSDQLDKLFITGVTL